MAIPDQTEPAGPMAGNPPSLELYRALFRTAPQGIVIQDGQGAILDANPAAERFLGLSLDQLQGRTPVDPGWQCIHADGSPFPGETHPAMEALRTGRPAENIVMGVPNPELGRTNWIEVSAMPLFLAGPDRPSHVFATLMDITDRKQAEDSLRASEEKFSKAFHSSPDSVNINRYEDGVYLAVNEGFTRITGYTAEDVLGHSSLPGDLGIWADEADRARLQAEMKRDGLVQGLEARFRRKDGALLTGLMSATMIEVQGQQCLLSITRDISERIRAEQEKVRLQAQLQQAQKLESLGTLAGGVAHDMNNVLGAILGIASANLDSQAEGSPAQAAFETIIKAAERGGRMVKSLLNLGHPSQAQGQELDLNAILCDEVQLLESGVLARVRLQLDLQPDLRPLRGDASAFSRAFMNIFVNAVDAMAGDGILAIRTRNLDGQRVEVLIEDTGTGMAKDVLEKALDPFFTTKPVGKGTGLGLSMVYGTVKAHQGQLDIQSEPGRGTIVRMRFPAAAAWAPAPEPEPASPAAVRSSALKVLFIDDDDLVQTSTRALLEVLGHHVTATLSGEGALAELEAGLRPDVVILDMNMPGLGGAGTLPRLRALLPAVPVLLATGRIDRTARDLVEAHPGVTLLSKPFGIGTLRELLESI